MTRPLERRYRYLFLTYPPGYREQHESEMLGTLLETAGSDQCWPSPREAVALLAGGLRTRARLAERDPSAMWAGALRLGALLLFGELASAGTTLPVLGIVGLVGVLAVIRARYALALVPIVPVVVQQLFIGISLRQPVPWLLMSTAALELLALSLLALRVLPLRIGGRPWPWRSAAPALLGAAVFAAASAIGQRSGATAPVLGLSLAILPQVVILPLTLIARDPRLGVAGLMVAIPGFLGSLTTSPGAPGQGIGWTYQFDLVSEISLIVCLLAATVTIVAARRATLM